MGKFYENPIPEDKRKYRKSIIESMDEEKIKKYGFEKSYMIFENSVNRLEKSGDIAEKMAVEYLKEKDMLSKNFSLNRVISLGKIKIEADIIDYDNKVIYETKSRKNGHLARQAVIQKWKVFEYDKKNSGYEKFKFVGIIVANYEAEKVVKGLVLFDDKKLNPAKVEKDFEKYFQRLKILKKIKKSNER